MTGLSRLGQEFDGAHNILHLRMLLILGAFWHGAFNVSFEFRHRDLALAIKILAGEGGERVQQHPFMTSKVRDARIAFAKDGHHRLLALPGKRRDFDFTFLDIEERVGGVALSENDLALVPFRDAYARADRGEKRLGIEDRFGVVRHRICQAGAVRLLAAPFAVSYFFAIPELFCTDPAPAAP